ncbi:MAG: metallophosphoesterase [Melioribacteraceae bacterium]|nr:metallophosphoesterase [Melioribacteraceae bacterium]
MKTKLKTIITVLLLLSNITFAQSFKFVAMSDSRGSDNGVNTPVLSALTKHMLENNPDVKFVVFAGDMVNGHRNDPGRTKRELLHWKEVMAPVYNHPNIVWPGIWPLVGNHEIRHREDEDNFRDVFQDVYMNGPKEQKGLSYSFDFGNSHFCIMNTDAWYYGDIEDTTDDRPDWHQIKYIDWVENDLKSARERGMKHIFTFSHEMPFPIGGHLHDGLPNLGRNFKGKMDSTRQYYLDRRDAFWNLMQEYEADAHICGHEHTYGRQEVNGVYQILNGSSGAPLYNFNPRPETDTTIGWHEMTYEEAVPYYEMLEYSHGPGKNSQRSENFVGHKAFNYSVYEVTDDKVVVKTYGAFSKDGTNTELGTEIELIDEFVMEK